MSHSRPGPASAKTGEMAGAMAGEKAGSSAAFADPAAVRYSAIRRPAVGCRLGANRLPPAASMIRSPSGFPARKPHFGPVAQRLEQGTHNPLVASSNLAGPSLLFPLVFRHGPALGSRAAGVDFKAHVRRNGRQPAVLVMPTL